MRVVNLLAAGASAIVGTFKVIDIKPIEPLDPLPIIFDDNETLINFYNESYYGSFSNAANKMVKFKFSTKTSRHYFYIRYYNNKTNALLVNDSYKLDDYLESDLSLEYTIKCKGKLYNEGLKIVFSTETIDGKEKKSKAVVIYPTISDTIYSYQYVNKAYTIDNRIFKIESNDIKTRESVRFENTIDYLTNDVNNAIDISEVTFTYDEGFDLYNKSGNKYLKILDLDNVYPNIIKDSNGYIKIPLVCIQNGKDITLKYKDHFYYNPTTLDVSLTYRNGYIETDKLYVPKGKLKLLENATFAVEMPEFGRSLINIVIPLTFVKDRNYLGLCSDSSHCIIGGIRE